MLLITKDQLSKSKFLETARASYPGGMSMYGNGVVKAGTKKNVSNFFISDKFFVPNKSTFKKDHEKLCKELSKKFDLNPQRNDLNKVTVAAKFIDTFLYQLMKFQEYRNLWGDLYLIIDRRIISRLKRCGDEKLKKFLESYPGSPYEANYTEYLKLQHALNAYLQRINSDLIKSRIELNFLWATD